MVSVFKIIVLTVALFCFFSLKGQAPSEQQREEWIALIQGGEIQTTEGLLIICPQEKCGCIDSSGTTVIPFKYDFIKGFYNGLAAVNIGGVHNDEGYPDIKNGKWGIIDKKGKKITALKYDYIPAIDHGWFGDLIPVELNGKQGLINRKGKKITKVKYDDIASFNDSLWTVSIMNSVLNNSDDVPDRPKYWHFEKYGLVDKGGEITPVKYSEIYSPIVDGFTKVKVEYFDEGLNRQVGKVGIIDANGKEIIPPIYHYIEDNTNKKGYSKFFSEGLALASVLDEESGYKYGYLNKEGEISIPLKFTSAGLFYKGIAVVASNGDSISLGVYNGVEEFEYIEHYGVINKLGEVVVPIKYDRLEVIFESGIIKVSKNGKWGLFDLTGEELVAIKYETIEDFNEGISKVESDGKWGIINTKGKELTPLKYDEIIDFDTGISGFAIVNIGGKMNNGLLTNHTTDISGGKFGLVNSNGNEVVPPIYDDISDFYSGLAIVELNGKSGFIDKSGKVVIPLKFDRVVQSFFEGRAKVKLNDEDFYIDKTGKRIE